MYEGPLPRELIHKWQSMINLMTEVFAIPMGLIACQRKQGLEIIVASDLKQQPYKPGIELTRTDEVDHFCKTLISETRPLAIYRGETDNQPRNPDGHSFAYSTLLGCPLSLVSAEIFGALCLFDSDGHPAKENHLSLLQHFCVLVESDLRFLQKLQSATDLSFRDDLTGLYNRRGFNVLSQKQYFYGKRNHIKFAFMIADIDRLKSINDNYGHKIGDKAIVTFADALSTSLRECDLVARVGGDEFYLALNLHADDEIPSIIARAKEYLERHPIESGVVEFSWGVSIRHYCRASVLSLEELIDEADSMLYCRKKQPAEAEKVLISKQSDEDQG